MKKHKQSKGTKIVEKHRAQLNKLTKPERAKYFDHGMKIADSAYPTIDIDGVPYGPASIRYMRMQLRGYQAASKAIDEFIKEARTATQPYASQQKRKLDWWKGRFQGLVAAECMMVYGAYPEGPGNQESIDKILGQ